MKSTTTLMDIIQSELIKKGHNEFVNNNNLSFFDKDFLFIQKVMKYDKDVESVVNEMFFSQCYLNNDVSDKKFKKTFINRFLNREIAFQTVEGFNSQVTYTFLINEDYLNNLYDNLEDYVTGKSVGDTDNSGTDLSDNRHLLSNLPQSEINLNVDNTVLDYGDTNTISRTRNIKEGQASSRSNDFNIDNLLKSKGLLEQVFNEFDKRCFMQVW